MLSTALQLVSLVRCNAADCILGVAFSQLDCLIQRLKNIWANQLSLSKHLNAAAIAIQEFTMLSHLGQSVLSHVHQGINFVLGPFEVLYTKGINSDGLDPYLIADLERLKRSVRLEMNL